MGLDNGIVLRGIPKKEEMKYLNYSEYSIHKDNNTLQICYWRKCWNIRDAIIKVLHMGNRDYLHDVDSEDIPAIIRELSNLLNKDNWVESDCIWEYEDMVPNIVQDILDLRWLQQYLDGHPDASAYFYDSY